MFWHKSSQGASGRCAAQQRHLWRFTDLWKSVAAEHLASSRNEAQVRNLLDGRCIAWFFILSKSRSSDRQLSFDVECGILLMELYILFALPYFDVERGILLDELLFLFAFLCPNAWRGTLSVDPCNPFLFDVAEGILLTSPTSLLLKCRVDTLFVSSAHWLAGASWKWAWCVTFFNSMFWLRLRAWCRQKKDFDQELLYNIYSLFTDTVAPAETHNKHMLKSKANRLGTLKNYHWTPHTAYRQHQPSNTTYHQRNSAFQVPQNG